MSSGIERRRAGADHADRARRRSRRRSTSPPRRRRALDATSACGLCGRLALTARSIAAPRASAGEPAAVTRRSIARLPGRAAHRPDGVCRNRRAACRGAVRSPTGRSASCAKTSAGTTRSTRSSARRSAPAGVRDQSLLAVSGRVAYEIVQKAAVAGRRRRRRGRRAVEPGRRGRARGRLDAGRLHPRRPVQRLRRATNRISGTVQ